MPKLAGLEQTSLRAFGNFEQWLRPRRVWQWDWETEEYQAEAVAEFELAAGIMKTRMRLDLGLRLGQGLPELPQESEVPEITRLEGRWSGFAGLGVLAQQPRASTSREKVQVTVSSHSLTERTSS